MDISNKKAGLPPRFAAAVRNLHNGTTCSFFVNGYASRSIADTRVEGVRISGGSTNMELKRAEIARAIAVPKDKFLVRHALPNAPTVDRLQAFIKGFVWGTAEMKERRAGLSIKQAELSCANGGIGRPDDLGKLLRFSLASDTMGDECRAD
ncbi:hypothetical protein PybrP1_001598 [[Pythium] brassicae (nom. inval.)]|nr:hypothetical protein PybrP1_001598 [[Pythium] brassicae (nom. inval.)]